MGVTRTPWIVEAVGEYRERLTHYSAIDWIELKEPHEKSQGKQLEAETALFMRQIPDGCRLILFDERGLRFTSPKLATLINDLQNQSLREVVFCVGGAFGFAPEILQRADFCISLSDLTFTHQMVRIIVAEQMYRAFTILRGERYHH